MDAFREVPQNIEAEKGVLGSCLLENAAIDEAALILTADDFFRDRHAILWRRIAAMRAASLPVDGVSLDHELKRHGEHEKVGGDDTLYDILDAVPHPLNCGYYANVVRQLSDMRRLISACNETLREVYAKSHAAEDLLARAETRIFAITEAATSDSTRLVGEFARQAMDRIDARVNGHTTAIQTGFTDLDAIIDGFLPAQIIYLAARTSVGKTAWALNVIEFVAFKLDLPVLMVSLEMAGREQAERLLSSGGRVDSLKLRTGKNFKGEPISQIEMARLGQAFDRLKESQNLWIDDSPVRTITQISANARRIKRRHGLALLVVDYLQLIDSLTELGKKASREERVSHVSRRLKILAKELDIPILCLSQLNRESEKRDGGRPRTSDLRESGALEQDADMVLLLHRPEMANGQPSMPGQPGEAELIVSKNRAGPRGAVRLTFLGEFCRFENFAPMPDYVPPAPERGDIDDSDF